MHKLLFILFTSSLLYCMDEYLFSTKEEASLDRRSENEILFQTALQNSFDDIVPWQLLP